MGENGKTSSKHFKLAEAASTSSKKEGAMEQAEEFYSIFDSATTDSDSGETQASSSPPIDLDGNTFNEEELFSVEDEDFVGEEEFLIPPTPNGPPPDVLTRIVEKVGIKDDVEKKKEAVKKTTGSNSTAGPPPDVLARIAKKLGKKDDATNTDNVEKNKEMVKKLRKKDDTANTDNMETVKKTTNDGSNSTVSSSPDVLVGITKKLGKKSDAANTDNVEKKKETTKKETTKKETTKKTAAVPKTVNHREKKESTGRKRKMPDNRGSSTKKEEEEPLRKKKKTITNEEEKCFPVFSVEPLRVCLLSLCRKCSVRESVCSPSGKQVITITMCPMCVIKNNKLSACM